MIYGDILTNKNMEYQGFERRDNIAPVLRLGQVLAKARQTKASGAVELVAQGQTHSLEITRGAIAQVRGPNIVASCADRAGSIVLRLAQDLFRLERPLVAWRPTAQASGIGHVDPESVVLCGVLARRDLFDPVALASRIPVAVLRLPWAQLQRLRHLPLQPEQRRFLESLDTPTPVTMALWKRGLHPQHAATLLTALNLLGAFEDQWTAADLPRCGVVRRLNDILDSRRPDHEILDVDSDADESTLDTAFRRIALELHPDRRQELPEAERQTAADVLARVSAAYQRLKHSRRRRRVTQGGAALGRVTLVRCAAVSWESLVLEAETAARAGDHKRARAFALKAVSCQLPDHIKQRLLGILAA